MAALTRQNLTKAGAELTFAAASAGGDTLANPTSFDVFQAINDDASPTTVTLAVPGSNWNGVAIPDTAIVIPAGETWVAKLDERYASSGSLAITYSSVTSLTVAVYTF